VTRPLPVDQWPELDRERWLAAQIPAGFLEPDRPASHWSPDRRVIVEAAYGRWLAFLGGHLDPCCTPGDRATRDRLRAFVTELQAQVAPVSAGMIVGALLRMLVVLEPDRDWNFLGQVYRHLKRTAVPSRDKLARMVPAADLFDLGLWLMKTWADHCPQRVHKATRYRDGLIIALLISCPIRLKNLAGLVIGQHLIFDGKGYRLQLTAAETKSGRPYVASVPRELTSFIDQWLTIHRPALQLVAAAGANTNSAAGALWIDRWGQALSSTSIQRQIWLRTRQAFGKGIHPHLFRDCAVTELVDVAPEEIGIAPDLLGHADLRTTRKYYIQATGVTAHVRVQQMIGRRRAAAARGDASA
jgi:integrase